MRYFVEMAYKGTNYHGWQTQPNVLSIQEVIETKLAIFLGHRVEITGSGRTDTGVHAKQQWIHFDSPNKIAPLRFEIGMNALLPKDIVVKQLFTCIETAHVRYDALSRSYEYHIINENSPFLENLVMRYFKKLSLEKLNEAAAILLKHTDFECFSKVHTDVKTFECTITYAEWFKTENGYLFKISANRFLRGMVRTIVGTMIEVGRELITVEEFENIILSKDRKKAGQAVTPNGLFLSKITYPENLFIS